MTNPIPVQPPRPVVSHDSIGEAIAFANNYSLQPQARKDSELLIGAKLEDSFWSATEL